MPEPLSFSLQSIRTDGWFERIGETIGSFHALCDIVGSNFFAFAMITGARITALTVDRRNPDNTLVDFVVGGGDGEATAADTQRLTLGDFRRRLVSALTAEEPIAPPPTRPTDTEALQLHVGVRYMLLAPLYGYALEQLEVKSEGSVIGLRHDGLEQTVPLQAFRARIRAHVHEELERASKAQQRGAIELSRVAEADQAATRGDQIKVLELLGAWPAPLAIFLRTPEGQLLNAETRATIAKGLGLLGSACIALDEVEKGEEVLRLAVQYAGDGPAAAGIFTRLGSAMFNDSRPGEAIGPLRRAINLGANGAEVWPLLADAFLSRGRLLAALAAVREARSSGLADAALDRIHDQVAERLGERFQSWERTVGSADGAGAPD
jgi:hypothetical protein